MRVLLFVCLFAFSATALDKAGLNLIDSDIEIEVVLPKSESSETEIYISGDEDIVISIGTEDYSYDDPDYGYSYETVTVTVNDENGSADSTDDLVAEFDVYDDGTTSEVYVGYETSEGEWGYADAYSTSWEVDETTTETYEYVQAGAGATYDEENWYYDEETGEYVEYTETVDEVYVNDYVVSDTVTTVEDGATTESTYSYGSVEGYGFEETVESTSTGDEYSGEVEQSETFSWWVNAQDDSAVFGTLSPVAWIIVAASIALLTFFLYKKAVQMKAFKTQNSVRAVDEESLGYIRI